MTVNQLIKKLQALPDKQKKWKVIMASDAECNRLSPLSDIDTAEVAETNHAWEYDFVSVEDENDLRPNAILLVPMN